MYVTFLLLQPQRSSLSAALPRSNSSIILDIKNNPTSILSSQYESLQLVTTFYLLERDWAAGDGSFPPSYGGFFLHRLINQVWTAEVYD